MNQEELTIKLKESVKKLYELKEKVNRASRNLERAEEKFNGEMCKYWELERQLEALSPAAAVSADGSG